MLPTRLCSKRTARRRNKLLLGTVTGLAGLAVFATTSGRARDPLQLTIKPERRSPFVGSLSRVGTSGQFRIRLCNYGQRLRAVCRYAGVYEVRVFDAQNALVASDAVFMRRADLPPRLPDCCWSVLRPGESVSFPILAHDKVTGMPLRLFPPHGRAECSAYFGYGINTRCTPSFVRQCHAAVGYWTGMATLKW